MVTGKLVSRGIRILFILLLLIVLVRNVDLHHALGLLVGVDPVTVASVLALFTIGQILSSVRWRLALGQIAPHPPGILTLFRLYLIGMFVNLGLPTMIAGDVVRAELARRHLSARGDAYASILADRLIGLFSVILLAAAAILSAGHLFEPWVHRFVMLAAVLPVLALAVTAPSLGRLGSRGPWRFRRFLEAILLLARRPKFLALSLVIAVVVQSVAVVVPISLLAHALGVDVPGVMHFVLVPVIVLATQLPIAPGGLGVRETAFVLLYSQVGVRPEEAFSLGLSWSLVLVSLSLVGGLLLLTSRPDKQTPLRVACAFQDYDVGSAGPTSPPASHVSKPFRPSTEKRAWIRWLSSARLR